MVVDPGPPSAPTRTWRLTRHELFKLRRRPMPLILLGIQSGIALGVPLLFYLLLRLSDGNGETVAGDQTRDLIDRIVFPGATVGAVDKALGLGLPLLVVLTASWFGGEFAWGTVRLLLARGVGRVPFIAAKLIAVVGWWTLALVLGTLVGFGVAGVLAVVDDQPGIGVVGGDDWARLAARLGAAWFVAVTYAAFTAALTVRTRSTALGVAGGLVTVYSEQLVGAALLAVDATPLEWIVRFGLNYNAQALMTGGAESKNSLPFAALVLAFFLLASALGAAQHLKRHDVVVAGVG